MKRLIFGGVALLYVIYLLAFGTASPGTVIKAATSDGPRITVDGIQTYTCIDGWPKDTRCTTPGSYRKDKFYPGGF